MARVLGIAMRGAALMMVIQGCLAPGRPIGPVVCRSGCGPEGRIDDGEDGDARIMQEGGRNGGWYTLADEVGSTIWPAPPVASGRGAGDGREKDGGAFTMSTGGRERPRFVARMTGKVGLAKVVYTALALDFRRPRGAYDASRYDGVSFYARRGPSATGRVRFMVVDASTDPAGGRCTECFNNFGEDLQLTTEWQRYEMPFANLRQLEGWGAPRPPHLERAALFGLVWQTQAPGADVDLWIDDVAFKCAGN